MTDAETELILSQAVFTALPWEQRSFGRKKCSQNLNKLQILNQILFIMQNMNVSGVNIKMFWVSLVALIKLDLHAYKLCICWNIFHYTEQ